MERACREANVQLKTVIKLSEAKLDQWEKSHVVMHGTLDKVLDYLPNLKHADEFWNYMSFLKIKKLSVETQHSLEKYVGHYALVTNIPEEDIRFISMSIIITRSPFFPVFDIHVAGNEDDGVEEINCDGFIIANGRRLALTGLSDFLDAFIVLTDVPDVKRNPIRGTGTFEHKISGVCYTSEVILVPIDDATEMEPVIARAKKRLKIGPIELK